MIKVQFQIRGHIERAERWPIQRERFMIMKCNVALSVPMIASANGELAHLANDNAKNDIGQGLISIVMAEECYGLIKLQLIEHQ